MRRRLYFVLPDVQTAKAVFDKLLLARIEQQHISFLAREDVELGDLPEATLLQRSDEISGLAKGLVIGGATGALAGLIAYFFPPLGVHMGLGVILAVSLLGAVVGFWISGVVASAVPNSHHKNFFKDIDQGKILLLVDVPKEQTGDIERMMHEHHPNADARGRDPTIPAFP